MPTLDSAAIAALRRGSRQAAILTAVGALVVVATLVYSAWSIRGLQKTVDAKKLEITTATTDLANVRTELAGAQAQLKEVQQTLGGAKARLDEVNAQLKEAESRLAAANESLSTARSGKQAFKSVYKGLPPGVDPADPQRLADLVKVSLTPTATAQPVGTAAGGRKTYRFTLSLKYPNDARPTEILRESIASVTYQFNYPGLQDQTSTDAAGGFPVQYVGWGALRYVGVQVNLKNGGRAAIDFDMAATLPELPEKGGKPKFMN